MRVRIRRDVAGSDIEATVPPVYRRLLLPKMFRIAAAHVIVFPQGRVVTLGMASRAVERLGAADSNPAIAFAHDASIEAREYLANAGVQLLTAREFGWSDTRYHTIHGGEPH